MAERSQSAAYATLTPCARKVLAVIEGKIAEGGGGPSVSLIDLATLSGVSDSTAFLAQKQAVLLGFVNIKQGPCPRNAYQLANGWRDLDADEAMRLRKRACKPMPKAPKPVKPRTMKRQAPSMPRMPWDDAR